MRIFSISLSLFLLWSAALHAQTIGFTQQQIASGLTGRDVKIADMDGDGDPDVLFVTGSQIAWIENTDGKGTFSPSPIAIGILFNANVVLAADVDGNGTMDVLVGAGTNSSNSEVALFKNLDTLGTSFGAKITLTTLGDEVRDLVAADFDGDNDLDIAYASYDTDQVIWLENTDGQGAYGIPQIIFSNANGARYLAVADADGDQDMDIFSSSFYAGSSGQFSWHKNTDGKGTFTQHNINGLDGNNAAGIAVGDLDGDSAPDLVGCLYNSARVYWYRNLDSMGTFSSRITATTGINGPFTVNIADLEGDGDPDLVVASEKDNKIGYLLNNGSGTFSPVVFIPAILSFTNGMFNASRLTATADMDADGDADIVAISTGTNQIVFLRNAPPLMYSSQTVDPLCHGDSTGAIYLSVGGGAPPYTITWANPALQGDTLTGLSAGDYDVTIAESGGSMFVVTITLTQPDSLVLAATSSSTPTGAPFGTAAVIASGGTQPYQYLWNTGGTSDTLSNLVPAAYTCTVTDANGCTAASSVDVNALPGLVAEASYSPPTCSGSTDGVISINASGGIPPYSIVWTDPNLSGFTLSGLSAGDYIFTLTDLTGIQFTDTITLIAPLPLELSLSSTPAASGASNGTASVSASGGMEPYSFLWTGGETTPTVDNLATGTYSVTVTDVNGCTETGSIFVDETIGLFEPGKGAPVIRVYPNPARDRIYLDMPDARVAIRQVVLSDLAGRVLYRGAGSAANGFMLLPAGPDAVLVLVVYLENGAVFGQKIIRLGRGE